MKSRQRTYQDCCIHFTACRLANLAYIRSVTYQMIQTSVALRTFPAAVQTSVRRLLRISVRTAAVCAILLVSIAGLLIVSRSSPLHGRFARIMSGGGGLYMTSNSLVLRIVCHRVQHLIHLTCMLPKQPNNSEWSVAGEKLERKWSGAELTSSRPSSLGWTVRGGGGASKVLMRREQG